MPDSTPARIDPSVPGPYQREEDKKEAEKPAEPAKKLSPDEIRQELDAKTQLIQLRIEAIKSELAQVPDDAKKAVQTAVFQSPLVAVGASLAAGLVVGLVFGKKKVKPTALSKALEYVPSSQRHLAERYVADLQGVLRRAERRGEDAAEAVQGFVSRHAPPVIVVEEPRAAKSGGMMGALGGIAITLLSALGKTAVQTAITALTAKTAAEEGSRQATKDVVEEKK